MSLKLETPQKLSVDELKKKLAEHISSMEPLTKEIADIEAKESVLQKRKRELAEQLRKTNHAAWALQEQLLVLKPISTELANARSALSRTTHKAASRDITIRQQEALEKKIEELIKAFQRQCDHRFVLEYPGYEGSYSDDYDDQYCGSRVCAVCGFAEGSESSKKDIYSILVPSEERLIKRDLRKSVTVRHGLPVGEQPFLSLLQIQNMFLACAGLDIILDR